MIRCLAIVAAGSVTGVALAALICWIWLATIDGKQLDL